MSDFYKVLITGSRDFTNEEVIKAGLREARRRAEYRRMLVIHGDARGADTIAGRLAKQAPNCNVVVVPADWTNDGRMAGPYRNESMLALEPDLCLAFFQKGAKNSGTSHMVSLAAKAGIPLLTYNSNGGIVEP